MKSLFSNSQRFSFRKSTIGLVSILLGTVLFTTGVITHADEETTTTTTTEVSADEQGFPEIPVPVIPGNFADRETVPFQEVNPGDGEQHYEELVLYKDLGSIKLVDQKNWQDFSRKSLRKRSS